MKTPQCKSIVNIETDDKAKLILKSELAKRGISYQKLADLLNGQGEYCLTKPALDNRMARGGFSADFFLDCLRAIGCVSLIVQPTVKVTHEDSK